jgi:hypothetical protein
MARLDYLLANRLFALQEEPSAAAGAPDGFRDAVATYKYSEIVDRCQYYLMRPEERAARAGAAYRWFKDVMSLDKYIPYDWVADALKAPPQ